MSIGRPKKKCVQTFCKRCNKRLPHNSPNKFCSKKCYLYARKKRGWFVDNLEFKKTYNCFNPSRCKI